MPLTIESTRVVPPQGIDIKAPSRSSNAASFAGRTVARAGAITGKALRMANIATPDNNHLESSIHYLGYATDSLRLLTTFGNIHSLIKEAKRKNHTLTPYEKQKKALKIAASSIGASGGVLTGIKMLNSYGKVDMPFVNKTLHAIEGSAAFAPYAFVSNVLGIAKSGLDIGLAALKLKKCDKDLKHIKMKNKLWKEEFTPKFAQEKIGRIDGKMIACKEEAEKIKEKATQSAEEVSKLQEKYLKTKETRLNKLKKAEYVSDAKRFFIKIGQAFKKAFTENKQKRALKKAIACQHVLCTELEASISKYDKLEKKKEGWASIHEGLSNNNLTTTQKTELEYMRSEKLSKWNIKKVNINWTKAKEGLEIAFNVISIIVAIASIILMATGVGAAPVLLAITALSIGTSLALFGVTLFKKFKKDKPYQSVVIPIFKKLNTQPANA